jgi:RNA polymerase sigma-70 factor, ECF subfamily
MERINSSEPRGVGEDAGGDNPPEALSGAPSELEIVACCLGGDRDVYRLLVEANQRLVYAAVSKILTRREDVEDVAQEAFLQGYKNLRSFRGDSSFSTWIYRIAVNLALRRAQQLRKQGWQSLDEADVPQKQSSGPDNPEDRLVLEERCEAVRRAVLKLPEKHRAVVALHYFENRSCPEIAGILGCSLGTVWSRLHYALKHLKKELDWLRND